MNFKFVILPYTLSDGGYHIVFDIAERNVKRYTTEKSNLYFTVLPGSSFFGNRFCEHLNIKSSLFREDWLDFCESGRIVVWEINMSLCSLLVLILGR